MSQKAETYIDLNGKSWLVFYDKDGDKDYDLETGFPINQKYPTTKFLIQYLTKLPTINNNSKFNKYLIRNDE